MGAVRLSAPQVAFLSRAVAGIGLLGLTPRERSTFHSLRRRHYIRRDGERWIVTQIGERVLRRIQRAAP